MATTEELLMGGGGACNDVATVMEAWLSSSDADAAVKKALCSVYASEGGGSHGRNITLEFVEKACVAIMALLPSELQGHLPDPDASFVRGALAQVFPEALQGGLRDEEAFSTAVQVVLLQLAASADMLRKIMHAELEGKGTNLAANKTAVM